MDEVPAAAMVRIDLLCPDMNGGCDPGPGFPRSSQSFSFETWLRVGNIWAIPDTADRSWVFRAVGLVLRVFICVSSFFWGYLP
jgi:hypothetical protein